MSRVDSRTWDPKPEDIARLPQWAQKYVGNQQAKVSNLEARLEEVSDGPENSRVRAMSYTYPDVKLGDATVDFYLGSTWERWEDMVEARIRDGRLVIDTHGAGCRRGVIQPVSSNSFEVMFVERDS
jgi:hypothetical protein